MLFLDVFNVMFLLPRHSLSHASRHHETKSSTWCTFCAGSHNGVAERRAHLSPTFCVPRVLSHSHGFGKVARADAGSRNLLNNIFAVSERSFEIGHLWLFTVASLAPSPSIPSVPAAAAVPFVARSRNGNQAAVNRRVGRFLCQNFLVIRLSPIRSSDAVERRRPNAVLGDGSNPPR